MSAAVGDQLRLGTFVADLSTGSVLFGPFQGCVTVVRHHGSGVDERMRGPISATSALRLPLLQDRACPL
ncbi:hypothetical protein [Acetobacter sp. DsW_063]|uniref:hypothetical protein n=1 Tax=Acetobacter sp. DsW_063 TaxID=1514894 RepID=UPI000A38909E|nr:hypothetical protein [Acetobacter sp. DsW_063]OUJ16535.1 hypothetical protein HK28_11015 [Acetobacter sp. DsW_063]